MATIPSTGHVHVTLQLCVSGFTYTAKLLFHQSPTKQWLHSDWTVTVLSPLLTAGSIGDYNSHHTAGSCQQWLHPHCPVTVKSLCLVGDWWNRSFAVYLFACLHFGSVYRIAVKLYKTGFLLNRVGRRYM